MLINRTSLLVQMIHSKYKGPRGSCQGQCKLHRVVATGNCWVIGISSSTCHNKHMRLFLVSATQNVFISASVMQDQITICYEDALKKGNAFNFTLLE